MPNALDSLFQAADALPAPKPGASYVVVTVSFFAVPGLGMGQGSLFYTRRTEVNRGKELIVEPAFFSGIIPTNGEEPRITLTAPLGLGGKSDYTLAVASPTLNGSLTPITTPGRSGSWNAYGSLPGTNANVGLVLGTPTSIQQ